MNRSCGDDCVDKLMLATEQIHSVTNVLNCERPGYKISCKDSDVAVETDSSEGNACNQSIRQALEKYKEIKLENLSAMARGKLEENTLKGK